MLKELNMPSELKSLSQQEKKELASEIRKVLIDTVSENGGHLASNLGVVELTIALHSVFNTPEDKIVWDVGHQTYVHKILTSRKDKMSTLRKLNGLAGFPKTSESEYDCFNTGHSSTSISAALGMARARDLKGKQNYVIAVIGDGALTGGMALEALNDAGFSNTNLIVILNDNEMSIEKNVGGIAHLLLDIRTKQFYNQSNNYIKEVVLKVPKLGNMIIKVVTKIKKGIKQIVLPNMFFEDLGFKYLGPVDGNNIEEVEEILSKAKNIDGPILIHVLTKKGKGYLPAEENPDKFHSISSFYVDSGKVKKEKKDDYSKVFGEKLVELAKKDEKIIAITAAMANGTGLYKFSQQIPNRFFDVGIAEQHALTMAAGLAVGGMKPVVSIYSSFYQRAYDQIIHDICLQKLPVVMCIDRAGIVGNDGETHQGIYDLAFLNIVPNLTIMAPKDFKELEEMLELSLTLNSPVAIRYPRGAESDIKFSKKKKILLGQAEIIRDNSSDKDQGVTIIAIGKMVSRAVEVSDILNTKGIPTTIINARFLKPLDNDTILKIIRNTKKCITIEDGIIKGGLGSSIENLIMENHLSQIEFKAYGYPDEFIKHGSVEELEQLYGLDKEQIVDDIIKEMKL